MKFEAFNFATEAKNMIISNTFAKKEELSNSNASNFEHDYLNFAVIRRKILLAQFHRKCNSSIIFRIS